MISVSKLTRLTKLSLDNTRITDNGLAALSSLSQLQYLNLVGTDISIDGLPPLSILPNLKQIFIFKTHISPNALTQLKQKMLQTVFDTSGYIVPFWVSDTAIFKKGK
jgi:Leucine-rich repeat (LRR) protein